MKPQSILSVIFVFAFSNAVFSQNEKSEKTILSVNEEVNKTEVIVPGVKIEVNEFSDTLSIITLGHKRFEIIEDHDDVKVRMTRIPREEFKGHFAGFELGFNMLMTSDFSTNLPEDAKFLELNSGKSINVGLNFLQYSIGLQKLHNNFGLVTGLGINFSNYRFDSPYILTKDEDTGQTTYYITDRSVRKNKLVTTYLNIPLLVELAVPAKGDHRFFINAGGFCGFNLGAHTKVVYNNNGNKEKDKSHSDYNIRPIQYGIMARMGYRFLKLYATYNMTSLFEAEKGPEVYPFTVGLTLFNF